MILTIIVINHMKFYFKNSTFQTTLLANSSITFEDIIRVTNTVETTLIE